MGTGVALGHRGCRFLHEYITLVRICLWVQQSTQEICIVLEPRLVQIKLEMTV